MTTIQFATALIGLVMAALRVANAARWGWAWLPPAAQVLLPAFVAASPALIEMLDGATTKLDIAIALIVFAGALGTAWRGTLPSKPKGPDERRTPVVPVEPVREGDIKPFHLTALVFLLVLGCAETQAKPPCDSATVVLIVGECSSRIEQCAAAGVEPRDCKALTECDERLLERARVCS